MKNLFLSLLVASAAVACNSTEYSVTDASDANAPGGDCATACATSCSDAQKAECSAAKAECSAAKTECSEAKTCPVTGETVEG
jgi:hypothetical protein